MTHDNAKTCYAKIFLYIYIQDVAIIELILTLGKIKQ